MQASSLLAISTRITSTWLSVHVSPLPGYHYKRHPYLLSVQGSPLPGYQLFLNGYLYLVVKKCTASNVPSIFSTYLYVKQQHFILGFNLAAMSSITCLTGQLSSRSSQLPTAKSSTCASSSKQRYSSLHVERAKRFSTSKIMQSLLA